MRHSKNMIFSWQGYGQGRKDVKELTSVCFRDDPVPLLVVSVRFLVRFWKNHFLN
jgi:hypothetical protein